MVEAIAALLDLAGVEQREMSPPRCGQDMLRMGTECMRRGTELVLERDSDFRVVRVLELPVDKMANLWANARLSGTSSEPMPEVIKVTEFGGNKRSGLNFVPMAKIGELMVHARQFAPPIITLPLGFTPGVPGLHVHGCSHKT
jgi:hypothetical protein